MAGSRAWDGIDDRIASPFAGGSAIRAAITYAVVVKPAVGNDQAVYLSDAVYSTEIYRDSDGLYAYHSAGSRSAAATPIDDVWQVLAWTKPAGDAMVPTLHRVQIGGGSPVHAAGDTPLDDETPFNGWLLGTYSSSSYYYSGLMVAAGVWARALSSAEIESLVTEAGWIAARPTVWWSERDGFATELVSGLATTLTGTAHSTDEPPGFWPTAGPTAWMLIDGMPVRCTVRDNTGAAVALHLGGA